MIKRATLHNVVPIGVRGGTMGAMIATQWIGTGFLVKETVASVEHVYLVTNKHVVRNKSELIVRIPDLGSANSFKDISVLLFEVDGSVAFSYHPNQFVDIAIISVDRFLPANAGLGFDLTSQSMSLKSMSDNGIGEGDAIYALGYPMGMVDAKHSYPVCRMGCISLISSAFDGLNPIEYIVDAQTFPGNSGGPIITGDNVMAGMSGKLIGILRAYIPYQEVLFSQQTQRQRSTMEENSGLTVVHPLDRIIDVVRIESARVSLSKMSKSASL